LALIVSEQYPETGARLLTIVVATTIVFEILGPLITRFVLGRAGELLITTKASELLRARCVAHDIMSQRLTVCRTSTPG